MWRLVVFTVLIISTGATKEGLYEDIQIYNLLNERQMI